MTRPTAQFVDASYVLALANARDQWHSLALRWQSALDAARRRLVITEYGLIEIGDGLSQRTARQDAVQIIQGFRASPDVEIIPASPALFDAGL